MGNSKTRFYVYLVVLQIVSSISIKKWVFKLYIFLDFSFSNLTIFYINSTLYRIKDKRIFSLSF